MDKAQLSGNLLMWPWFMADTNTRAMRRGLRQGLLRVETKMVDRYLEDGILDSRLDAGDYDENFGDAHPPLDAHEAMVAADRCYFCYDAPCVTACPTGIDIPKFIRQISTRNLDGSARTIFDQNILGGMCARVCPTETLCEQACVREAAEGKPVQIGLLQRHATDHAMSHGRQFYSRANETGKSVAVIGAGPAGLACAHRLAMKGHTVIIYDARDKAGGLNEYGIATYKTVDDFAQHEVDYVTAIGGIEIVTGQRLGNDLTIDDLTTKHDAVFVGIGLSGVNALGVDGEEDDAVASAVDFIAELRQAADMATIPVGRRVMVIGGGMTAIDVATQAHLLGAQEVTIAYRRGREQMNASEVEQNQSTSKGVNIRHWMKPVEVTKSGSGSLHVKMEYTSLSGGRLTGTGKFQTFEVDQLFKAIGQTLEAGDTLSGITLEQGRIKIDEAFRTSNPSVWAGGDCTAGGDDLTVTAVAQGRDAAESIHAALSA
jgi:dihydropyrimidine dehydrogenase (NAD+) subunit PreT|tara:strand:+ start:6220 stop:7680 length:1461 start_codon:yes stop_codon:yes gene_type:complete